MAKSTRWNSVMDSLVGGGEKPRQQPGSVPTPSMAKSVQNPSSRDQEADALSVDESTRPASPKGARSMRGATLSRCLPFTCGVGSRERSQQADRYLSFTTGSQPRSRAPFTPRTPPRSQAPWPPWAPSPGAWPGRRRRLQSGRRRVGRARGCAAPRTASDRARG